MTRPENDVHIRLYPAPAKRLMAVATCAVLTLLLAWLAFNVPPMAAGWRIVLALAAVGAGLAGVRMWRATAAGIELTDAGLADTDGNLIAALDNITRSDRGLFAFKPTNGFLLTLRRRGPVAWRPGLWWRIGRWVGVGGTLPGGGARALSDAINALLAQRSAPPEEPSEE